MLLFWVFIIGVFVGITMITLGRKFGELYQKLMSLSHFHLSFGFKDKKPKEIKAGEQKQLED